MFFKEGLSLEEARAAVLAMTKVARAYTDVFPYKFRYLSKELLIEYIDIDCIGCKKKIPENLRLVHLKEKMFKGQNLFIYMDMVGFCEDCSFLTTTSKEYDVANIILYLPESSDGSQQAISKLFH